jgi:hypothetical protein
MSGKIFDYNAMVENALRGVVRDALHRASETGMPGNQHFYVTFRTDQPGVDIPSYLHERYPDEMTIVLQHQFWGLDAGVDKFEVTLSFNKVPERLVVPYAAVTGFADPSVQFGLQFRVVPATASEAKSQPAAFEAKAPEPEGSADAGAENRPATGEVVALDAFRKKKT